MVSSLLEKFQGTLRISEGVLAASSSLLYPRVGAALEVVSVEFKDLELICTFFAEVLLGFRRR